MSCIELPSHSKVFFWRPTKPTILGGIGGPFLQLKLQGIVVRLHHHFFKGLCCAQFFFVNNVQGAVRIEPYRSYFLNVFFGVGAPGEFVVQAGVGAKYFQVGIKELDDVGLAQQYFVGGVGVEHTIPVGFVTIEPAVLVEDNVLFVVHEINPVRRFGVCENGFLGVLIPTKKGDGIVVVFVYNLKCWVSVVDWTKIGNSKIPIWVLNITG